MRPRLPFLALTLALCTLAVPAAAGAKTTALSGQVIGTPYVTGAKTSVPVLIARSSVAKARLTSPVGVLVVATAKTVAGPARSSFTPGRLRVGDTFRAGAVVDARARRAAYPTLKTSRLTVVKRSAVLSNDELTAQLGDLTKKLAALDGYVHQLAAYTVTQITSLRADLSSVRADLGDLRSQLAALQAALALVQAQMGGLNNLPAGLVDTVNALSTQVGGLGTTVTTLSGNVGTLTTGLADVTGKLVGISAGQLTGALTDIGALQTTVAGLNVASITSQLASLTTKIGAVGGVDLQSQVTTLSGLLSGVQTTLTTATGQLSFLCSAKLVTNPLGGLISLVGLGSLGTITSCP